MDVDAATNSDDSDGLFGFKIEDEMIIKILIGAAKSAMSRDDVSNVSRLTLVKFMHCLQQLPKMIRNVHFEFTLNTQDSVYGFGWRSVIISDDEFEISTGEYIRGPVGGDSSSQMLFQVGKGWQKVAFTKTDLVEWAQQFKLDASYEDFTVLTHDYSGEEIDMADAEDTSRLWENLSSDYL